MRGYMSERALLKGDKLIKIREQLAKATCSTLREREKEHYRGHCEFKLYQTIYSIGHNSEFYSDE